MNEVVIDRENEISLYIHIPFCIKKCLYCDFLSFTDISCCEKYINALLKEISLFDCNKKIRSIFIGGGTPSYIDPRYIYSIGEFIAKKYHFLENTEFTIEANPGTLTAEKVGDYISCGINRISMGLQSCDNRLLKILGRIHNYDDFLRSYELAKKVGNVNIDIMFALPEQTLEDWQSTLEKVTKLEPEHISAYSLIIEEGTAFYNTYREPPCDEDTDRQMYWYCRDFLKENGYEQYEISNFAKKGYCSVHNLNYWRRGEYKGFGLGAASLINEVRYKNTEDMAKYINGTTIEETEKLSLNDRMSEFMFLGLRCTQGISISEFKKQFCADIYSVFGKAVEKAVKNGLLIIDGDSMRLTALGVDLSNMVFVDFLL